MSSRKPTAVEVGFCIWGLAAPFAAGLIKIGDLMLAHGSIVGFLWPLSILLAWHGLAIWGYFYALRDEGDKKERP